MIVFIDDKPSASNLDPDIPFVGTSSYKNLLNWIAEMKISINDVKMANIKDVDMFSADQIFIETKSSFFVVSGIKDKFIALGKNADEFLTEKGIQHYTLPNPSPENRLLNNKPYIRRELKKCQKYLTNNIEYGIV